MTRLVSSVAVQALKVAAMGILIGCVGCASAPPSNITTLDRHVVPNALAHVALVDFEIVSFLELDLHTAVQTREAVESEFKTAYGQAGHPRWFFHAFDGNHLDFIVARFEPKGAKNERYVAERRLRVKRTREAERALGVIEVVREYEVGTSGIKAGMSKRDVVTVAGRAESERGRGQLGSFDLLYPAFCARFVQGKVVHVWRREACTILP